MTKRNKRGSREQGPGRGREVEERDEERAREPEPERRSGRKFARIISWHLVKVDREISFSYRCQNPSSSSTTAGSTSAW